MNNSIWSVEFNWSQLSKKDSFLRSHGKCTPDEHLLTTEIYIIWHQELIKDKLLIFIIFKARLLIIHSCCWSQHLWLCVPQSPNHKNKIFGFSEVCKNLDIKIVLTKIWKLRKTSQNVNYRTTEILQNISLFLNSVKVYMYKWQEHARRPCMHQWRGKNFGIHHKEVPCLLSLLAPIATTQFSVYIVRKVSARRCCMQQWRKSYFWYIFRVLANF